MDNDSGCLREMTFEEKCSYLRDVLKAQGNSLYSLMKHDIFNNEQSRSDQHSEMKANIMLAYRHIEDARMRVGKILQAAGDGVSILDKK